MSWSADRSTIVSGLPAGYTNIPLSREPDDVVPTSHEHKSYSLKLGGVADIEYQSADEIHYSHLAILRVIYLDIDGTQRITNEGLAMTLMQTISNISGFHTFADAPELEGLDKEHFIFNLAFHFGFDDNV